jgi:hypothetical protein
VENVRLDIVVLVVVLVCSRMASNRRIEEAIGDWSSASTNTNGGSLQWP